MGVAGQIQSELFFDLSIKKAISHRRASTYDSRGTKFKYRSEQPRRCAH